MFNDFVKASFTIYWENNHNDENMLVFYCFGDINTQYVLNASILQLIHKLQEKQDIFRYFEEN